MGTVLKHTDVALVHAPEHPALTVEERAYARMWLAARGVRRDWEEIVRYKEVRERRERPFRLLSWHLC